MLSMLSLVQLYFKMINNKKSKTKYCWWCGRKLRPKKGGGYSYSAVFSQGYSRIVHKQCVQEIEIDEDYIKFIKQIELEKELERI